MGVALATIRGGAVAYAQWSKSATDTGRARGCTDSDLYSTVTNPDACVESTPCRLAVDAGGGCWSWRVPFAVPAEGGRRVGVCRVAGEAGGRRQFAERRRRQRHAVVDGQIEPVLPGKTRLGRATPISTLQPTPCGSARRRSS